jgi:glutathione S-transferase
MLTIHHLGHSQSDRILWLCEELGIDYKMEKYDRSPVLSPPKYLALHPIGAAPVIDDGDVRLAETGACFEYILNVHGDGRLTVKPGGKNYADYLYWYHFANGTMQPAMGRVMMIKWSGASEDNNVLVSGQNKVNQVLQHMEQRLEQVPYLAGEQFTAADIFTIFSLTGMREYTQEDLSKYPNIVAYMQRVAKRDGYRRAMQKGDPDIDIETLIQGPPPPPFKGLAKRK